jgi:hypothetical protein
VRVLRLFRQVLPQLTPSAAQELIVERVDVTHTSHTYTRTLPCQGQSSLTIIIMMIS